MNMPKFLITTAATAAIVGAVGLSYAQNNTNNNSTFPRNVNETPGPKAPANSDSSSGMTSNRTGASTDSSTSNNSTSDSTMSNERVAQADRN